MIGHILGHYKILEKIGEGGMGVVYRAHDERLDRDVALKVLPAGTLADESARRRFRKEALALARLNHANIAAVYDFDTQEGADFLVMEFITGTTLSQMATGSSLPEKEIARLGGQMADGLAAAHAQGVVHRDLKPGNLRITPEGQLKILDFGLAKQAPAAGGAELTESATDPHAAAGTLPYMAPEQLQGAAVDARTDLYAAGTVLFEMATGRRPFEEKFPTALVGDILHKAPPTPGRLRPDISPRLEEIILKCLDKDPDSRYQSARELAVDLRRLTAPSTTIQPVAEPFSRRGMRAAWLAGAGLLLLAALLFGFNIGGLRTRLLRPDGAATRIDSLAVLPLENLSHNPEQEFFVDGMTDELISDLAKISALRVISRTSVMQYKGKNKPLPEIARELGVDAVVEGSVLRDGERVRITAQLIAASPERHLWSNSYERTVRDVLALQSEVARAIATEIQVSLTPQEQATLSNARPVDPEVHEAYLKGRYYLSRPGTPGQVALVEEQFHKALAKNPQYAPAYAGLAELHVFGLPSHKYMPEAREEATKALELDESLAEAHMALGLVKLYYDWDWTAAEKEFKRGIEVNPGSAVAHSRYAIYLWAMQRFDDAIAEMQRAQKLDPLSVIINSDLGRAYYFARQYDLAIQQYQKTLELEPNNPLSRMFLGIAYEQVGRLDEAFHEIRDSRAKAGDMETATAMEKAYAAGGYPAFLKLWAERWEGAVPLGRAQPWSVALIYARLGIKDKAFEWLEKSFQERTRAIVYLNSEPQLDKLRGDPRLDALRKRIGLPPPSR